MGAYLSEPITKKESSDEVGKNVAYGASSMQGWRISQEDAHNCCIEFDENVSLFAVYDGHGGHEVATYCARNLPDFIKQTEAYKKGDIRQALIDAFLGFDDTLTKPEVVNVLKELAGTSTSEKKEGDLTESDEEENVSNLCMEATMPLEQVMAKYQSEVANPHLKNLKGEKCGKRAFASPYLRGRRGREKTSGSSSGAGCSSSPSPPATSSSSSASTPDWNTNETDVSSSSQPCGSTLSSTVERKDSDCPGSNEAEQVLDSTTSNGSAHASPPVVSTADVEPAKSMDMPDSSEDVKEKVSSPGKAPPCAESNANEVEVNGAESKRIGDADSSKGGGDNVSSSSCTPVENGDAGQQERITSSGRRRTQPVDLYQSLLKKDNDDSEEDDDDDENDETFDGVPESDGDDTEDIDEDESDEDDEVEEEEEEEDLEDDSDDDTDDLMIEKPGSDSGCTAVVAILKNNELYVANAGDSRCVLCRDGQAIELSLDHKPEDAPEMERIVKAGGEVTSDGRVNGGLNLSRALGDHAYKRNMVLPPQEQMISALPDVRHITIDPEKDEFMVLACDGIWNFMTSQNVVQFVRNRLSQNYENISKICEELFDHCLAPDTLGDGTGCDNMTAVIVKFKSPATETVKNNTVAEVCVTKKRSVSPAAEENNDCIPGENTVNPCKRAKTEAAM
ncbi:probable protein phosphatase CG10417 isoform X1 [Temnothorax curvispinosus]|uniref:protein-serine/threonine phosphatase n=1 Tax=Temnothorax curvispinosus TaxID=300111 RepID=A0A6J1QSR3_9HYME|nr:probable protein phosphatase CG10417 isoform X1 [Temnothorax curvispinosus]